jgi:hypothetical protein
VFAVFAVLVPASASLALMIETIRVVARVGMTAEMTKSLTVLMMWKMWKMWKVEIAWLKMKVRTERLKMMTPTLVVAILDLIPFESHLILMIFGPVFVLVVWLWLWSLVYLGHLVVTIAAAAL